MRQERDALGEVSVPDGAYYGAQTARAIVNFSVSGRPLPSVLIRALGEIKADCAVANGERPLSRSPRGR